MSDTNTTILTVAQVCERLTISEPTLRRYARAGVEDFPRKVPHWSPPSRLPEKRCRGVHSAPI